MDFYGVSVHIGGISNLPTLYFQPVFVYENPRNSGGGGVDVRFGQQVEGQVACGGCSRQVGKKWRWRHLKKQTTIDNRNCFFDAEEFVKKKNPNGVFFMVEVKTSP